MPKFRLRHYSYHEKNWTYGGKLYNGKLYENLIFCSIFRPWKRKIKNLSYHVRHRLPFGLSDRHLKVHPLKLVYVFFNFLLGIFYSEFAFSRSFFFCKIFLENDWLLLLVTVSQLAVSFELERYLLSVFFQSYFPGMIMVILGGLSMFLDAKSVPARVSMGKNISIKPIPIIMKT